MAKATSALAETEKKKRMIFLKQVNGLAFKQRRIEFVIMKINLVFRFYCLSYNIPCVAEICGYNLDVKIKYVK